MKRKTVLIAGAGFSKPLGGPLLGELLDDEAYAASDADADALNAMRTLLHSRDSLPRELGRPLSLEDVFTILWQSRSTERDIDIAHEDWNASELYRQLQVHLASVCGRLRLDRRRAVTQAYIDFLSDEESRAQDFSIVSFNYDTLVEDALDAAGIQWHYGDHADLEFDDSTRRRSLTRHPAEVAVFKLHGSANWGVCRGCSKAERENDVIVAFEKPYIPTRRTRCPFCSNRMLESAIVPPIVSKAGEVRFISSLWAQARAKLKKSTNLLSIGYSLPSADGEATSLLMDAALRGETVPEMRVICGPRGAPTRYSEIFGERLIDMRMNFEDYLAAVVER